MSTTWVVVADASRGRYFTVSGQRTLEEREDLVAEHQRQAEQDRMSDRPGRTFDSGGQGRHAMEAPESARQQDAVEFARRVAERIEALRGSGELDKLVLFAPPKFLGQLRAQLSDAALAAVAFSESKELTQQSADVIAGHLPERF